MTKYTEKEIKEMDEQELVKAIDNKNISMQDLININVEMTEPVRISLLKSSDKKEFSDIMEYFIYKKLITEAVAKAAVKKNYYIIHDIIQYDKNLVTEEIMLFAIKKDIHLINTFINNRLTITEAVVKLVLERNFNRIEYIIEYDKNLITEEVMLIAIEKDIKWINAFIKAKIPMTEAFVKAVALRNKKYYIDIIKYFVKDYKNLVTEDIMLFAIKEDFNWFKAFIEARIPITEAVVKAVALENYFYYIDNIQYLIRNFKKLLTEEIMLFAIKKDSWLINNFIKEEISITEDIMLIAIEKDSKLIDAFIKAEIPMTDSFLSLAVNANPKILKYHKELFTEEIILEAIKQNTNIVEDVFKYRNELSNESFELAMVKANYLTIQHIKFPSKEVQKAAVLQNKDAVKHIKNPCEVVKKYLKEGVVAIKKEAIESLRELIGVSQDLEKNIDGCDDDNIAKQKLLINNQNQNNN